MTSEDERAALDPEQTSIADVLSVLDDPPPDPRALYYRWEREQWEAGVVDLSRDRAVWGSLDPATRTSILSALSCFLVPDGRVTDLLVPFVDAVASEEEQVFLTSQLVDEARAVVFADRFFTEVVQGRDPNERTGSLEPSIGLPNAGLDGLLGLVRPRAESVRVERVASAELHEGLLLLDVVFEGVVAVAVVRVLGGWLENEGAMPGLAEGVTRLTGDITRHVHFGSRLLQEAVGDGSSTGDAGGLEAVIEEALPYVQRVVNDAAATSADFAGLPFGDSELSTETMDCLARRMHDVGIDLPT